MSKYKKVILDFETTGLSPYFDEILQVSLIDQDGNTILDEYCKPKKVTTWEEAEQVHGISPDMVKDKRPFEDYIDKLSDILTNTDLIIIYNVNFELGFLKRYGVKYNENFYDVMIEFAEIYGEWNEYYCNYRWQKLETCCKYYGYHIGNAHNSLVDCIATLYCYNKIINNEKKYDGGEYLGKTVKDFLDDVWKKTNNEDIALNIYPVNVEKRRKFKNCYVSDKVSKYEDIKYTALLDYEIKKISYYSPTNFVIFVDKYLVAENDLLKKEVDELKEEKELLKREVDELNKYGYKNYRLYIEESEKVTKLEKKINKLKEQLSLIPKKEIAMINSYGYYTAEYCRETKKPMLDRNTYEPFKDVLLSKSRCKQIRRPVNDNEEIYAFYRVMHGYCALYYRNPREYMKDDKN